MTDEHQHCSHWWGLEACCECGAPAAEYSVRSVVKASEHARVIGRIALFVLAVLTLAALVLAPGSAPVPIPTQPTATEQP